jgi:flagellar motor component MotA
MRKLTGKSIFIKLTGAGLILGIILSAILYGSPLSIFWDFSAFMMAMAFILPRFFSKSINQSSTLWGIVIAGVTGLILMVFNINEPSKLGLPVAFSLLVGLYIFVFRPR